MGMGRGVGRDVVGAEIGLYLNNTPDDWTCGCKADQQLAEKARGNMLRLSFKEGARHQATGRRGAAASALPWTGGLHTGRHMSYFCCLFHSLMRARTSSA